MFNVQWSLDFMKTYYIHFYIKSDAQLLLIKVGLQWKKMGVTEIKWHHDIAEILLKLALNTNQPIK
jgi:hypothetical protein